MPPVPDFGKLSPSNRATTSQVEVLSESAASRWTRSCLRQAPSSPSTIAGENPGKPPTTAHHGHPHSLVAGDSSSQSPRI